MQQTERAAAEGRMRSFAKRGFFLRFGCIFGGRQLELVSLYLKSLTTSPTPQLHHVVEDLSTNSAGTDMSMRLQLAVMAEIRVLMRPYRRSCGARSLPLDGHPQWLLDVRRRPEVFRAMQSLTRRQQWPRSPRISSSPPSSAANTLSP